MRTFVGERSPESGLCRVYVEDDRGQAQRRRLKHRTGYRSHSPSGFEWGYAGSGPAELARALCVAVTGDAQIAPHIYQAFKARVVVSLPHDGWRLTEAQITDVLRALRGEGNGSIL